MSKGNKWTQDNLSSSWFFRWLSLAFIVNTTPILAVSGRGLIAFFLILYLGLMAGFAEKSFGQVLHLFFQCVSSNKLFFVFSIWYSIGFILYSFSDSGLGEWRLMMGPIVILIAIGYMFAFMNDEECYRKIQIAFILISGVQAVLTIPVLYSTVNIARLIWSQTGGGAWIYGSQIYFAIYAIIIPLLFWRSLKESGIKKVLLLLSCLLIVIECALSSFGTPLALLILAVLIICLLAIFSILKGRSRTWSVLIIGTLILVVFLGNQYIAKSPLFSSAYERIVNFVDDPRSGGYSGSAVAGGSRWILDQISINRFLEHPLFGVGGSFSYNLNVGGHSSFFDSLAIYGLLGGGGALCGMILVMVAKADIQFRQDQSWESLLSLTAVLLLVIAGVMNPYWGGALPMALIMVRPFCKAP